MTHWQCASQFFRYERKKKVTAYFRPKLSNELILNNRLLSLSFFSSKSNFLLNLSQSKLPRKSIVCTSAWIFSGRQLFLALKDKPYFSRVKLNAATNSGNTLGNWDHHFFFLFLKFTFFPYQISFESGSEYQ